MAKKEIRVVHGKSSFAVSFEPESTTALEFGKRVAEASDVSQERLRLVGKKIGLLPECFTKCVDEEGDGSSSSSEPLASTFLRDVSELVLYSASESDLALMKAEHAKGPTASAADVQEYLQVCSAVTVGRPILQPRFGWVYFAHQDQDFPILDVCGPCAHTCFNMEDIHILPEGPESQLHEPFACACSSIRKTGHECTWAGCTAPKMNGFGAEMEKAWKYQQERFAAVIEADREKSNVAARKAREEKMTKQIKSQMELFDQYFLPGVQDAARRVIPTKELMDGAKAAHANAQQSLEQGESPIDGQRKKDAPLEFADYLLKELLRWFKNDFFTWVTRPNCSNCGGETKSDGSVHPNPEETMNWASNVEHYKCNSCGASTRLPRYNRAERLLTWRKGRCGEWTNCFALLAITLGFDVRFVLDLTDHVWVECYSNSLKRWVHCDPCENAFDTPLMYESGWGKQLNYIFAISREEVVDVIRRYSAHPTDLPKRDDVSERFLSRLVRGLDAAQRRRVPSDRLPFVKLRRAQEDEELALLKSSPGADSTQYQGRQTGGAEWTAARGEDGASRASGAPALAGDDPRLTWRRVFSPSDASIAESQQFEVSKDGVHVCCPFPNTEAEEDEGEEAVERSVGVLDHRGILTAKGLTTAHLAKGFSVYARLIVPEQSAKGDWIGCFEDAIGEGPIPRRAANIAGCLAIEHTLAATVGPSADGVAISVQTPFSDAPPVEISVSLNVAEGGQAGSFAAVSLRITVDLQGAMHVAYSVQQSDGTRLPVARRGAMLPIHEWSGRSEGEKSPVFRVTGPLPLERLVWESL